MKIFVGLGNPGKEYDNTRHNIGFEFIDYYLDYKNIDNKFKKKFNGNYILTNIGDEQVIFLKPLSYMNLSGGVLKKFIDYFKIDVDDIYVICDDLDLKVGNFKFRNRGSSGGHNGLKDIGNKLSSNNFKRLKIGISKTDSSDKKDYVLGKFNKTEREILDKVFQDLIPVMDDYFQLPFEDLMSKYNRKNR